MARIILFGLAGAGKDTVAQLLKENLAVKKPDLTVEFAKFATTFKRAAFDLFGESFDDRDVKEVPVHVPYGQIIDVCDATIAKVWPSNSEEDSDKRSRAVLKAIDVFGALLVNGFLEISPRKFQQLFGTDVVRSIEESAWVNIADRETSNLTKLSIISDGRFINEALEDATLVYVFRPKTSKELHELKGHASEVFNIDLYNKAVIADTSVLMTHEGKDFYILDNLGDLDELAMNVDTFVEGWL